MKVWAIGDYYRVNPVTNRAFEDNPMLFPDSLTGHYKDSNLVWDAAGKTVSIKAARNETAAFQIIVERIGDAKLTNVNVKIGELVGPGGKRIPEANVDLFKEWYVNITKQSARQYSLGTGWYPDALIPCLRWSGDLFPRSFVLPFDVPDLLNSIGRRQRSQALWMDFYIPKERESAPPGEYKGTITISSDAGKVDLEVRLAVWDFMLPEENHLHGNFHTDTEIHKFPEELELKYYQLIRKHRLAMGTLGYAPGLKVSGTDLQFDWSKYDARLAKYLDGSAFTEKYGYHGPGYGVPIEILVLPFDVYPVKLYSENGQTHPYGKEWKFYRPWPVELPKEGPTPAYAEVWKKGFKAFQDHFDQHPGWDKTKLVVFLLSLDEAYDKQSAERMRYYGQLVKDAGATRLKYRVDGWYPMETMRYLAGVLDIAILGLGGWDPVAIEEIKKLGIDPWFYLGAGWTDGDVLQSRALSWIAWKYKAGSWTLWELDWNSLHAWMYPDTYPDANGHGFFVYRGETMGLDEPVASVRLKNMRRGAQDYEYFWLAAQRNGGRQRADELVNSVVRDIAGKMPYPITFGLPGMWSHNPEDWERARIKLGDWLEKGSK